jgi:hypothetical protein
MDKLSSILAPSPRVTAVDLNDSQPIRPGVTTYGRPVGTTLKDRFSVSQDAKDVAFSESLASVNPKEAKGAKIAHDMYKKLFEQKALADEMKGRTATAGEEMLEREADIGESMPQISSQQAALRNPAAAAEMPSRMVHEAPIHEAPARVSTEQGMKMDLEA